MLLSSVVNNICFLSYFTDGKQFNTNRILSPRMDYDDWTPLGRGDPLKNDPTYDYVPPMLDKVKYWMSDGDNSKKQSTTTTNSNEVLLLGVSSLKKSSSKPSKKYTSERPNLLDPAYTQHQKNKLTRTTYGTFAKGSKQNTNNRFANDITSSDNYVQESSQMSSEKRTDPLETLLQFVSGKFNSPQLTTPAKPIAPQQQQQEQQLFNQQQQLRQQYEQQVVKVPDLMLIPPMDTTSSNTWFLSEPTDNQLFTQVQNVSNFNFKPADNVTDVYDLVTQNHLVTPTSYDVQTSLKLQDVITQTNYPLVYQSNISTYTTIPAITPTTIKAQEITPTIYKLQSKPSSITSVDYKSQSNAPVITPAIGFKNNNVRTSAIPVTYSKFLTSVTPINSLLPGVSSVTPLNFNQNTLFATPQVYKSNFITEPSKLSHTSWITPSVSSYLSPITFKLTTPTNQAFIKHGNPNPPSFKMQNNQAFSNWKVAQNQIHFNNFKFTTNPQQNFHLNNVHPPLKTNGSMLSTPISSTASTSPSTIIFCNQTISNITSNSNENKVSGLSGKHLSAINKTLLVSKQSLPTMNLIIQGHSKVKKYGAAKIDKLSGIALQEDNKENKSRKSRAVQPSIEGQTISRRKRKIRHNFLTSNRQLEVVEEFIPVYDDELEEALQDLLRQQGQGSGFGQLEENSLQNKKPLFR